MEKSNILSEMLGKHKEERGKSHFGFSGEISIPEPNVRSVVLNGDTTLDTLILIANAMEVSLNALAYGRPLPTTPERVRLYLRKLNSYVNLPSEKQMAFLGHLAAMMELLQNEN